MDFNFGTNGTPYDIVSPCKNYGCVYCSGNWTQYAIAIDQAERLRKYLENKRKKKLIINYGNRTHDH